MPLLAIWVEYFKSDTAIYRNLVTFLWEGGKLNALLLLFNLLPLPPLDGATILSGISRTARRWLDTPEVRNYGFFVLLILVWFAGGAELLWGGAATIANSYLKFVLWLLP